MDKNPSLNKSVPNSYQPSILFHRLSKDSQKQLSKYNPTTNTYPNRQGYINKKLEHKMSSSGWLQYILDGYFKIKTGNVYSLDNIQRYGVPLRGQYIIDMHDKVTRYIKSNPNNSISKNASYWYDKIARRNDSTDKLMTKANRYNLNVSIPHVKVEEKLYNGHRIHIPLSEVL